MDLYSESDISAIIAIEQQNLYPQIEEVQAEIKPAEIDPSFWGIDPEAWKTLPADQQRAVAATHIAYDRFAMQAARIEPDDWVTMPLEERAQTKASNPVLN